MRTKLTYFSNTTGGICLLPRFLRKPGILNAKGCAIGCSEIEARLGGKNRPERGEITPSGEATQRAPTQVGTRG